MDKPDRRQARKTHPLLPLCCLLVAAAAEAQTIRVDVGEPSADNSSSCGSEATPCRSIQAAVNSATNGDTILVAAGTYLFQPSLEPAECVESTAVVCVVNKELTILGGYDDGNWSSRTPDTNRTIIDGQNLRRGVLIKRGSPLAPPAGLRLEGFTIERGRADSSLPEGADTFGGGFSAVLVDHVTLRDLLVRNNVSKGADTSTAGGAGRGGGISIRGGADFYTAVILERLTVEDNLAQGGYGDIRGGRAFAGGINLKDIQELEASDLVVRRNHSKGGFSSGTGAFENLRADALGGGIGMIDCGDMWIQGLEVLDNTAEAGGPTGVGGIGGHAWGGGLFLENSTVQISDARVQGNRSLGGSALSGTPSRPARGGIGAGGGFNTFNATVTLDRVWVLDNLARGGDGPSQMDNGDRGQVGGGGGYFEVSSTTYSGAINISNSVFADNSVELGNGHGASGGGGGIFLLGIDGQFVHSVLANNGFNDSWLGGLGAVINTRLYGQPGELRSSLRMEYSLVSGHQFSPPEDALRVNHDSTLDFNGRPTMFANNATDIDDDEDGYIINNGALLSAADIEFVSPGAPNYDYHLQPVSPAIDAAVGSSMPLDIDRQPRRAPRDLGADEACSTSTDEVVLSNETAVGLVTKEACDTITARHYRISGTGEVTFTAGVSIVLESGFRVEPGGVFVAKTRLP